MRVAVKDLRWLADNSPFVFVGRLAGKASDRDSRGLIVTRYTFDVERVVLGKAAAGAATLTLLGGTVGGETLRVSHLPEFAPDERYVVFTDLARTVYDPITGNASGVFRVGGTSVYTYDGRGVLGVVDRGLLRVSDAPQLEEPNRPPETRMSPVSDPTVRGGRVARDEAGAAMPERPISLEEFLRAIVAAAQR